MKKYTKKQIKELKDNPYTFQVDEKRIFLLPSSRKYSGLNIRLV